MTRVKRGYVARARRRRILNMSAGFRGAHSILFRTANQQTMKALRYAYRDRKDRKRTFRRLWITRINARVRAYGMNYSQFIHGLRNAQIGVNRKILSQIATLDEQTFAMIVEVVKN